MEWFHRLIFKEGFCVTIINIRDDNLSNNAVREVVVREGEGEYEGLMVCSVEFQIIKLENDSIPRSVHPGIVF